MIDYNSQELFEEIKNYITKMKFHLEYLEYELKKAHKRIKVLENTHY